MDIDQWAAEYQKSHGHPPLIIDQVYDLLGHDARLDGCSDEGRLARVEHSEQGFVLCEKTGLKWKPGHWVT